MERTGKRGQRLGVNLVGAMEGEWQVAARNWLCERRRTTGWIVGGGGNSAGCVDDGWSGDGEEILQESGEANGRGDSQNCRNKFDWVVGATE